MTQNMLINSFTIIIYTHCYSFVKKKYEGMLYENCIIYIDVSVHFHLYVQSSMYIYYCYICYYIIMYGNIYE
jgi:hypothetical protein